MLNSSRQRGGFTFLLHLGLWLLLVLLGLSFRPYGAHYDNHGVGQTAPQMPVPVAQFETLFASNTNSLHSALTNEMKMFSTRYFMPPIVREEQRHVELTYQGFYEVQGGLNRALVLVGNSLSNCPSGSNLVADLVISEVLIDRLVITNSSGQTNTLQLNRRQSVEIPAQ